MEFTRAGRAGGDHAVGFRATWESDTACSKQSHYEVFGWPGAYVGDAEVHGHIFAGIDHAVARRATFSRDGSAAVTKQGQLPSGNADLPNASTVGRDTQVTLHVRNLHVEDGNAWQACTQRYPARPTIARMIDADVCARVDRV